MVKRFLSILFVVCCLLFPAANASEKIAGFNGYVSDGAYVFSDIVLENMNRTIEDLEGKTGRKILVVTIPSLNSKPSDEYVASVAKSNAPKVVKGSNDAIYFFAKKENYLQLYLTEELAKKIKGSTFQKIGMKEILPYLKTGEFDKGLVRGVYLAAEEIAKSENKTVELYGVLPPSRSGHALWWWLLLIPVIFGGGFGAVWFVLDRKRKKAEEN